MRTRREYQIACPFCHARPGSPCKGRQAERLPGVHFQRTVALRKAALAALHALYAPLRKRPELSHNAIQSTER